MSVAPGWYTDPYDEQKVRYWDGSTWTEQSAPRASQPTDGGTGATGSLYGQSPEHAQSAADAPGAGGVGPAATVQMPAAQAQGGGYGPGQGVPPSAPSGPGGAPGYAAGAGFQAGGPGGPGGQYGQGGPGGQYGKAGPGGPGGPGGPYGPGGPAGQGPERRRNPALIALAVILGLAVVGVGGFFGVRALTGDDDTQATTPPSDAPQEPTTAPTLPPPDEQPTTEEATEEESTTTEEPTTEEETTTEPSVAVGEMVGNEQTGAAYFTDADGEVIGTAWESRIEAGGEVRITLHVEERAAVIFGGHSTDNTDLQFEASNDSGSFSGQDSYSLMPVFGFYQGYLDPAGAWVMDPGDYEFVVNDVDGAESGIEFEVHSGSLVVGVPSDTPVTISEGDPSVFILHVGEETALRAGVHGDEDTVIHVVDPELYVYQNDDAPSDHNPRNPLDASVDIESMPVGDSVIVASTFWGDPTDAVVSIHPN
jgi:hypothetical protein